MSGFCRGCNKSFPKRGALRRHWGHNEACMLIAMGMTEDLSVGLDNNNVINDVNNNAMINNDTSKTNFISNYLNHQNEFFFSTSNNLEESNDEDDICPPSSFENILCEWNKKHELSGKRNLVSTLQIYKQQRKQFNADHQQHPNSSPIDNYESTATKALL